MGKWAEPKKGGFMSKKITWADLYKDFKMRLPTLSRMAVSYRPYDHMTIAVYLKDGTKVLYDGLQKRAWFSPAA